MTIGYAHVSTTYQNLDAQIDALITAGVERLFSESVSGAKAERLVLDKMLDQLRDGYVVMATKYDCLARLLRDRLDFVEAPKKHDVGFHPWLKTSKRSRPPEEPIFYVFASIAHFGRQRIPERAREGLTAARGCGRPLPYPQITKPKKITGGEHDVTFDVARAFAKTPQYKTSMRLRKKVELLLLSQNACRSERCGFATPAA